MLINDEIPLLLNSNNIGFLSFQLSKNNFKSSNLNLGEENLNLNKLIGDDLANISKNLFQLNKNVVSYISKTKPSKNWQLINKFSNSKISKLKLVLMINDSLRYLRFGQF